jgi:hypothetical protein
MGEAPAYVFTAGKGESIIVDGVVATTHISLSLSTE